MNAKCLAETLFSIEILLKISMNKNLLQWKVGIYLCNKILILFLKKISQAVDIMRNFQFLKERSEFRNEISNMFFSLALKRV